MPFGFCNSLAIFQHLMKRILSDQVGIDVLVYLEKRATVRGRRNGNLLTQFVKFYSF